MTAKFNLLVVTAIPAIAIVPLLACGGGSEKTTDASTHSDAPGNGSGSGSGSGSNVTCALPANVSAFVSESVRYRSGSGSGSGYPRANRLSVSGFVDAASTERIQVAIYGGCGSTGSNCQGFDPNTPDWPTTFGPKSNVDLVQATDATIIGLVGSGASAVIYAAQSGTLNVSAAGNGSGAPFAGSLSNVVLVHVDIGSNITPDPDGCTSNVALSFSGSAAFTGKTIVVDDFDDESLPMLHHRFQ